MTKTEATVWCLLGAKAGDNTQVLALADELGYPAEHKKIVAQWYELLVHVGHQATLRGIDVEQSSPLQAPWPDIVISAGRRNEAVAQWIKAQSKGRTSLVHIGRPWAPLDAWDLIVTTPQYFLPKRPNIHHNSMPLLRLSVAPMREAAAALLPRLESLPRPWVAVFLGGDSGRFVLTPGKAETLGGLATDLAVAAEGALLATDSPRTPVAAGDALQAKLNEPNFCYRFNTGGSSGENNPYLGLLALADAFIVTGESMSMLAEAAATGKPLFIFDVGDGDSPWWMLSHNYRYKPLSFHLGMALAPQRMRRDVGRIQNALVESGKAQWLQPEMVFSAAEQLKSGFAQSTDKNECAVASSSQLELAATAEAVRQLVTPR